MIVLYKRVVDLGVNSTLASMIFFVLFLIVYWQVQPSLIRGLILFFFA
jgi:hypothetical protein